MIGSQKYEDGSNKYVTFLKYIYRIIHFVAGFLHSRASSRSRPTLVAEIVSANSRSSTCAQG